MKRMKRHKIKREKAETSSTSVNIPEEQDLAYYIHDRVELMHQVFSVLKPKDLKAMAPACVRRLSVDDLQELCTEELLGISSKRLLAILDGAEPPSDTESSSQSSEHMEAISLDSISSDEELLSTGSKKKHKHKRRDSKSKKQKKQKKNVEAPAEHKEQSKASRAGLTVLELLELQARARAIRAQLQQEQAKRLSEQVETTAIESSQHSSDSEVEIKEEPAEVVILSSSEDEKPDLKELEKAAATSNEKIVEKKDTGNDKTNQAILVTNEKQNDSSKTKKKKEKRKKKDKDKNKRKKDPTLSKESDKNKASSPVKDLTAQEVQNEPDMVIQVDNTNQSNSIENSNRTTKRVSDLIITVPQQSTRKIKLNRSKMTVSISNTTETDLPTPENTRPSSMVTIPEKPNEGIKKVYSVVSRPKTNNITRNIETDGQNETTDRMNKKGQKEPEKTKSKDKTKKKKKEKRESIDEDHDEITLQLSDTEKMDLLEDFDRKDYERVSSSSSDSDSSSSESTQGSSHDACDASKETFSQDFSSKFEESQDVIDSEINNKEKDRNANIDNKKDNLPIENDTLSEKNMKKEESQAAEAEQNQAVVTSCQQTECGEISTEETVVNTTLEIENTDINLVQSPELHQNTSNLIENKQNEVTEIFEINDIPIQNDSDKETHNPVLSFDQSKETDDSENVTKPEKQVSNRATEDSFDMDKDSKQSNGTESTEEGEISDADSSEIEAFEMQHDVVCISDDETPKNKRKKDKKSKKEKQKKSDICGNANQNFDKLQNSEIDELKTIELEVDDDDDVYEILELSDDSSCYEVEGITLSKEPTDEEIAALSAKIDEIGEIERVPIITEEEIREHENLEASKQITTETNIDIENVENISWKDRYLDSKKVKKVLTTSNILNALRKKNKELKKKIEESKKKDLDAELQKQINLEKQKQQEAQPKVLEDGSMEQYNTLQSSTKYVDPVPDPVEIAKKMAEELKQKEEDIQQEMLQQEIKEAQAIVEQENTVQKAIEEQVTGEMKKDAKQLLKMYKRLLKYNDVTKTNERDAKKKKNKKKKKKEKNSETV